MNFEELVRREKEAFLELRIACENLDVYNEKVIELRNKWRELANKLDELREEETKDE